MENFTIFRDIYDQDTNTEENLRTVLEANGVRLADLTEEERTQVLSALAQMSGASTVQPRPKAKQSPMADKRATSSSLFEKKSTAAKTLPRAAKNQKEIVIEIAELKGKGYPAPVDLDTGTGTEEAQIIVRYRTRSGSDGSRHLSRGSNNSRVEVSEHWSLRSAAA